MNDMTATIGLDNRPYAAGIKDSERLANGFRKTWESNNRRIASSSIFNRMQATNLASQGIDIASGLATGQRPLTIFLQQGGQVLDLLIRRDGGLIKAFKDLGKAVFSMRGLKFGIGAASAFSVFDSFRELKQYEKETQGQADLYNSIFRRIRLAEREVDIQEKLGKITSDQANEQRGQISSARQSLVAGGQLQLDRPIGDKDVAALYDQASSIITPILRSYMQDGELADSLRNLKHAELQLEVENLERMASEAATADEEERLRREIFSKRQEQLQALIAAEKEEMERATSEAEKNRSRAKILGYQGDMNEAEEALFKSLAKPFKEKSSPADMAKAIFRPQTDSLSAVGGMAYGSAYGAAGATARDIASEIKGLRQDLINRGVAINQVRKY